MEVTTDPLAGFREELNSGARTSLMWALASFPECPVKEKDVFELRSCSIEITSTRKVRRSGAWFWLALFNRYHPERIHLLGKAGGYVEDPRESMLDDPQGGAPFEPEAVPPDEVERLPSTQAARAKHLEQKDEEQQAESRRKEGERALRDHIRHALRNIPIARHQEAIERITASIRGTTADLKR